MSIQLLTDEAIMIQSSIKTTFPIILNRPRIGRSESAVKNIENAAVGNTNRKLEFIFNAVVS